jgi:hypothetical protein
MKITIQTIIGVVLSIIISFSLVHSTSIEDEPKMTLGSEFESSILEQPHLRANLFYSNFYDLPIKPLELEIDFLTISMQKADRFYFSFLNLFILPAAMLPRMIAGNAEEFYGFGLLGFIIALPQLATNFKINYPIVTDHLHIYVGEATDYFIYGKESRIFTASKVGIKGMIGPISLDFAVNKPWLKAYLKDSHPFFNVNIGFYLSRKAFEKMEKKNAEEDRKNGIFGPDWQKKTSPLTQLNLH